MTLAWPISLIGLLFVLGFAALYVATQRRRQRYPLQYSSVLLLRDAVDRGAGRRKHVPAALYLVGLAAFVFALARPSAIVPLPQQSGTVILVVDASRSMDATDVRPNRIEAAKEAIREFVRKEPKGIKIGVVAFSASAYLLTPPTEDRAQVLGAVNYLSLGRGTNIGEGLQVALDALRYPDAIEAGTSPAGAGRSRPAPVIPNATAASIILLSDGASTIGPDPLDVAADISRAGIATYTVGIGTVQGGSFQFGGGRNRQLDELTLKGIAEETGGKYFSAQNATELHQIYDKLSRQYTLEHKEMELTVLPAAAGLLLLLAAGVLGVLWRPKLP